MCPGGCTLTLITGSEQHAASAWSDFIAFCSQRDGAEFGIAHLDQGKKGQP
jgi:hypothetical protein